MLVVLVATTVSLSLIVDRLFRHIAENYEVEWPDELSASTGDAQLPQRQEF